METAPPMYYKINMVEAKRRALRKVFKNGQISITRTKKPRPTSLDTFCEKQQYSTEEPFRVITKINSEGIWMEFII